MGMRWGASFPLPPFLATALGSGIAFDVLIDRYIHFRRQPLPPPDARLAPLQTAVHVLCGPTGLRARVPPRAMPLRLGPLCLCLYMCTLAPVVCCPPDSCPPGRTIVAVNSHWHDNSLALARCGTVLVVSSFKMLGFRDISLGNTSRPDWTAQWRAVVERAVAASGARPPFDVGVAIGGRYMFTLYGRPQWAYDAILAAIPAKRWVDVRHTDAHAAHAFYDSPFANAAVLTIDGGGDWPFHVYTADRAKGIAHLRHVRLDVATAYQQIAQRITSLQMSIGTWGCRKVRLPPSPWPFGTTKARPQQVPGGTGRGGGGGGGQPLVS